MSKQFFYTERKIKKTPSEIIGAPEKEEIVVLTNSFNLDRVLRTVEPQPGLLVVLLDDGHEETVKIPTDKKGGTRNERQFVSSEILLYGEDISRYRLDAGYFPELPPVLSIAA